MAEDESLLPFNSTPQEKALSNTVARIGGVPVPVGTVWNPATCPAAVLPFLAWALSVDDWDSSWSEAVKRAVIAEAVSLHRTKGTPGSIKKALIRSGYAEDVTFQEGGIGPSEGGTNHWAEFGVTLHLTLDLDLSATTSENVRRAINIYKPARSKLIYLIFDLPLNEAVEAVDVLSLIDIQHTAEENFGQTYYDAQFSYDGTRDHQIYIEDFEITLSHSLDEYIRPANYHDGSLAYDGSHLYAGLIEEACSITISHTVSEAAVSNEACSIFLITFQNYDGLRNHDGWLMDENKVAV